MRKLAFETNGFEMPSLSFVGLEKENNNVVFATPKTVYKGGKTGGFSRSQLLAAALSQEESDLLTKVSSVNIVNALQNN